MTALVTRPLFTIEAQVGAPVSVGNPGGGIRRFIPILGGTFTGIASGIVLPGADWQTVLEDGTIELQAHYALETPAHERIEVISEGVRTGPPEVMAKLSRGEAVDPSLYYFRTAIRFKTGAAALTRLNHILAVAKAERLTTLVKLDVHEVL